MPNKVYYNSACPVCNAGIKNQRKRMEACGLKDIEWVDVHTNPGAVSEIGASLNQVRERLYVKDLNGKLNIGADAFSQVYGHKRMDSAGLLNCYGYLFSSNFRARCTTSLLISYTAGIVPRGAGNHCL